MAIALARFRGIANDQVECARRDFAETTIAIERDGDANRGVVAGEAETTFN